jgi:acetylornithine/succinyldiaminopimelate/putrescine aminotransferase
MKDVIITVICVAVLGAAGFFATYRAIQRQQAAAIAAVEIPPTGEKLKHVEALRDLSQQQAEDVNTRYKYSILVSAAGVLIGIGLGVLICDMVDAKQKQHAAPTPA